MAIFSFGAASLALATDRAAPGAVDPGEAEGAYLDPPYTGLVHPVAGAGDDGGDGEALKEDLPSRSNVEAMIARQTPVKQQSSRGTCTFFSTVAVLEAQLIRHHGASGFGPDTNLSEQWLAYLVSRTRAAEGSNSNPNFNALAYYGIVREAELPYEPDAWFEGGLSTSAVSRARCGRMPANLVAGCLLSHYDPRYLDAPDDWLKASNPAFFELRSRARRFRADFLAPHMNWRKTDYTVRRVGDIKALLQKGIPLTLDADFYYGAWAHGKATVLGIGRDANQWSQGLVGYPALGSRDRVNSRLAKTAHSVEVVGYDDSIVVSTTQLMVDGTWRRFTYQGVYYVKNSWGTTGFGSEFRIGGAAYPGYGMITQQYAHEFGAFYRMF